MHANTKRNISAASKNEQFHLNVFGCLHCAKHKIRWRTTEQHVENNFLCYKKLQQNEITNLKQKCFS